MYSSTVDLKTRYLSKYKYLISLQIILIFLCLIIFKSIASAEVLKDNIHAADSVRPSVVSFSVKFPVKQKIDIENILGYWFGDGWTAWWRVIWYSHIKKEALPAAKYNMRTGTGFVINSNGLIVTNEHLITDAEQIVAQLSDGRKFPVRVITLDRWYDLAIVSIAAKNLKVPTFGNSDDVKVGEQILLMGNALGFSNSVSQGIISGKGRHIQDEFGRVFENVLQTDAAMNFGDSGGPLVNMDGEVIGLNLAVVPQGQNISFAMPINECRKFLARLLTEGKIKRGWIGVKVTEKKTTTRGTQLFVDGWQSNSPSVNAGFQKSDIVVDINGFRPETAKQFYEFVRGRTPGEVLKLHLMRQAELIQTSVRVATFPDMFSANMHMKNSSRGMILDPLIPETRPFVLLISMLCLWLLYRLQLMKKLALVGAEANRRYGERRKGERRKGERRKIFPQFSAFAPSLNRRKEERRQKQRRKGDDRRD